MASVENIATTLSIMLSHRVYIVCKSNTDAGNLLNASAVCVLSGSIKVAVLLYCYYTVIILLFYMYFNL